MDYMELTKDLIDNDLDARVAAGEKALELTLGQIKKTIALLEPMVKKSRTKPKVKSVHTVEVVEETPQIEVRTEPRDKSIRVEVKRREGGGGGEERGERWVEGVVWRGIRAAQEAQGEDL